jgi:hypothetical protein
LEYSSKIFLNFVSSNLNFGKGVLQHGESVNIGGFVVARPGAPTAMRGIVAEDKLQARAERQFLGNLAPAPAGDFGNSVNITRQPAGAV